MSTTEVEKRELLIAFPQVL